jgi:hypothetical protein
MKNIFMRIAFLILIVDCYSVTAQLQKAELIGKWELDYNVTSEAMEIDVKKTFNSLPDTQRSVIEKAYKGRQMIFTKDNVFELKLSDERSSIGGWELTPDQQVLKIKNEKANKEYLYKVVELTNKTLVIEELDMKGKGYYKKLHFKKLKN